MEVERYSVLIVWFLVQLSGTMVIQMIINAIGSLSAEVFGLKAEWSKFTKSLA